MTLLLPDRKRLFNVTASCSEPVAGHDGKLPAPVFHPNSFTVMSYVRP